MQLTDVSKNRDNASTNGGHRQVAILAFPVMVSLLSQTLMSAVDVALLGHFGTVEQGAAGLAGALFWPFWFACTCIGHGVNIFVAQAIGAGRRTESGAITWQGLYSSVLAWLPMLLGGLAAVHLVQLSGASPALQAPAALYLRLRLLGGLPGLWNVTLAGFFRGIGDSRTPLWITLVVEVVNIVLDILLIFGYAGFPRLGIAGSAIATVMASSVGTVMYLNRFLSRGRREGLLTALWIPPARRTCQRLMRVSWPMGLQAALEMAAWTVFTIFIARLGSVEAAVQAVVAQLMGIAYMSSYGVSIAATTLVGQYLGARDLPAAWRSALTSLKFGLLLLGTFALGFWCLRQPLMRLTTADPAVGALGADLMASMVVFLIFDGLGLVAMGILRGAGDTRWPMWVGLGLNWLVFVPMAAWVLLGEHATMMAGWWVGLFYVALQASCMVGRVWHGGWQHRQLV